MFVRNNHSTFPLTFTPAVFSKNSIIADLPFLTKPS